MRVAILEDDPDQSELARRWLTDAGYAVSCYADSAAFLRAVRQDSFDLYLLDWLLPDLSGLVVLGKLRREMKDYTPTIIATVKDEERSIIAALETGADDYLVKPVRRGELVARVHALLRRAAGGRTGEAPPSVAPYTIDPDRKTVTLEGEEVALTNREYDLLMFFFRHVGKMISRSHLLEELWGIDNKTVSTRTVDTHVSRLRRKLHMNGETGWRLSSVYQHGYRIENVDKTGPRMEPG